jgi:cytochrome c oxidase subunit 3
MSTTSEALARARERRAEPNGIWGMALFLCAEIALFGTMFGAYYYLDFTAHRWPPPWIKPESIPAPAIATGWLALTLIPIWFASRSARAGLRRPAIAATLLALTVQSGYLVFQIFLYVHDFHHFKPQGSAYGSMYYTLLTLDHAHVAFGLLLDLVLIARLSRRGLTNYWLIGMRGLALYWYVVVAITVLVLLVQLTPSL